MKKTVCYILFVILLCSCISYHPRVGDIYVYKTQTKRVGSDAIIVKITNDTIYDCYLETLLGQANSLQLKGTYKIHCDTLFMNPLYLIYHRHEFPSDTIAELLKPADDGYPSVEPAPWLFPAYCVIKNKRELVLYSKDTITTPVVLFRKRDYKLFTDNGRKSVRRDL